MDELTELARDQLEELGQQATDHFEKAEVLLKQMVKLEEKIGKSKTNGKGETGA